MSWKCSRSSGLKMVKCNMHLCPCCALYVVCCYVETIGSHRRAVGAPEAKRSHKGCWWFAAWLGWTSTEGAKAREQLWLSRRNRAEPGSCWLLSEYAVCVWGGGLSSGSSALIHSHIFTLQITTKQFSGPQMQTWDIFIDLEGWVRVMEGWAEECMKERGQGNEEWSKGWKDEWLELISRVYFTVVFLQLCTKKNLFSNETFAPKMLQLLNLLSRLLVMY